MTNEISDLASPDKQEERAWFDLYCAALTGILARGSTSEDGYVGLARAAAKIADEALAHAKVCLEVP